ncbi:MAG: oxidoreductase [Aquificota bacterium]|nr:MAG: oxidoreductase [Aquificota bacterium]
MHRIVSKTALGKDAYLLSVEAPHISKAKPGQFVMLQKSPTSEPIPISVLETHPKGFTCFVKVVGRSTLELVEEGEEVFYVAGPLGKPFPVESYGRVVFYTKDWGIAPAINVAKALREKNEELYLFHEGQELYLEEKVKEAFTSYKVVQEIERLEADLIVCAGSNALCKKVSQVYKDKPVVGMVSVHMLDAVGLCLVCRVLVEGSYRLACSEGPWFDAHKVDWDNLISREGMYAQEERTAYEEYLKLLKRRALRQA